FASSSAHLYQAAFRILSNPHDAEDAVQDSLLCAFRNLNQFHGRARFSTWLHRIAINSSLMRLRKRKCRREFPLEPVGTGKELVARAIHFDGLRREKAFVPVDCSALTPTLIESELFGHIKGAFTGAERSKLGLLQTANEGTIFLDEIGELSIFLQAKLL